MRGTVCRRVRQLDSAKGRLPCQAHAHRQLLRWSRTFDAAPACVCVRATARGRTKGTKLNLPVRVLCEWDAAAAEADAIVLNRGYHSLASEVNELKADLNDTFAGLGALLEAAVAHRPSPPASTELGQRNEHAPPPPPASPDDAIYNAALREPRNSSARPAPWQRGWRRWAHRRHGRSHTPTRVVYRGTHASIYKCAEYADPLQSSIAGVHAVTHAMHIHRSNANAWYAWRNVYAHHRLDQDTMASLGVTYLNTYIATSLRPGGRLSPQDCNHFCLPGPPDEWTRLLLAFLT